MGTLGMFVVGILIGMYYRPEVELLVERVAEWWKSRKDSV